jgi:hypothetical protein
MVALNCRTLPNPVARATSAIGSAVSSISRRARWARRARAIAAGEAPRWARKSRRSWRAPSVHLPGGLLEQLERTAKRRRVSRNRLIVEACRAIVGEAQNTWPDDFFARRDLRPGDLELLRSTFEDWSRGIHAARRSRKTPPL